MEKIIYENGDVEFSDAYTKLYYTNLPLRPSCGKCKFARIERASDFTIGDFWGIQNSYPDFNDERGVSVLFLNTERAVDIFDEISPQLEILNTTFEKAIQPNLLSPTRIPAISKKFWKDFNSKGIMYCIYCWPKIMNYPEQIKQRIKKILKDILRRN